MPTLRPNGGTTYCTVETGIFSYTYDGSTSTGACFKKDQTCLSEWYWTDPVNVTKFNIRSHYYYPNSRINGIWGRVNGAWVEVWHNEWKPAHATWDSKVISCNNCTGIRISQTHISQPSRPCITEVTVDYEEVVVEGKATIVSITKPSTFTPNVEFRIRPTITNVGDAGDTLFLELINRDTGAILGEQEIYVSSGRNWVPSMYVTLTQTTDFHGSIEAGHIEIGNVVVDDTEDFTIPVTVECSEGDRETLEYCPDGSVKRERVCENGQWREYEYTCPPEPPPPPPPPPECSEGARETLEYCWDGSVKRERVCENGEWREYTYTCPTEPECSEDAREVLEFCPDGYTAKRERICENGKWREYTYDCPPEPEICYEGDREVLEFCPDGYTAKRERICENGKWREYTYECPPAPPPEEGIIDMILRRIQEFRESLGW